MRFVMLVLCLAILLPSCGWRRIAVERHQQTQEIKRLEIERRQAELSCLKRAEIGERVDCSQYRAK